MNRQRSRAISPLAALGQAANPLLALFRGSRAISPLTGLRRQLFVPVMLASLVSAAVVACDPAPAATPSATQTSTNEGALAPAATAAPAPTATTAPVPTKPPVPTVAPTAALTGEQLMVETVRATNAAQTLKFDMVTRQEINITGGSRPMAVSMAMDATGVANLASKEMQMNTNMNMDIPEQGRQTIQMQMYAVGGYAYLKMEIPGEGDQWMKMPFTDQIWQDQIQIDQQMALLQSATQLRIAGTENVGGIQTYVVEVTPDMQAMFDLIGQSEIPGMEELDVSGLNAIGDLFKDTSVRYWISKDKNLLTKVEMRMAGEIPSSAMGGRKADFDTMAFDTMAMDVTTTINYTFNQPVKIALPQEALSAPQVPGLGR